MRLNNKLEALYFETAFEKKKKGRAKVKEKKERDRRERDDLDGMLSSAVNILVNEVENTIFFFYN